MNPSIFPRVILFVCVVALSATYSIAAEEAANVTVNVKNPHTDQGDCSVCHVAPVEKLRSWFAFGSTKRQLTNSPTVICQKCHGISFGHGVGKKPAMNRAGLPLSADGTINCAMTCHNMHIKDVDDPKQQHFHLRLPQVQLCVSCHDK